jgi:hypothetical protein
MGHDSSSRQLIEQLSNGRQNLTCIWDENGPFKVSPIFPGANSPRFQLGGGRRSNLNQGPMSGKGQRGLTIRQGAANDEMIIPVDQDADHGS